MTFVLIPQSQRPVWQFSWLKRDRTHYKVLVPYDSHLWEDAGGYWP